MATITFNLDKTENDYIEFEGQTIQELELFLYPNQEFKDCCGTIFYTENERKSDLTIAAVSEYGVYLGFSDEDRECLSISDKSKLDSLIDIWGDGLYVSEGLFISPQSAWQCICKFIETGDISEEIDWITPDDLPEEANYITV